MMFATRTSAATRTLRAAAAISSVFALSARGTAYSHTQAAAPAAPVAVPTPAAVSAPRTAAAPGSGAACVNTSVKGPIRSVVLYQYESCPFCNKVRAYLDYARIPYVVIEVNPLTKSELAWNSAYGKVPVAVINGVCVNDSVAIMDTLDALVAQSLKDQAGAGKSLDAAAPRTAGHHDANEAKWRSYVDGTVVHLLSPNLYRTMPDALNAFDYLTQRNFPVWSAVPAKYIGAVAMYFVGQRLKKKHMTGEGDERAHLIRALDVYADEALAGGRPFSGGATPNLADVSLFGMLRAISSLSTFRDVMAVSRIAPWYERMAATVGSSSLQHRIGEAPLLA